MNVTVPLTAIGVSILCSIAALPTPPACAAEPVATVSRTDHVLYTLPSGWKREEKEGYTALIPPNVPEGNSAEIRLIDPVPVAGSAEGNARARLEYVKGKYANVQATPVSSSTHRNGFEVASFGATMETAAGSGQFQYAFLVFPRAGDQVHPVSFVADDHALYAAHSDAMTALVQGLRLSDLIVLADGKPPLTQAKLDQTIDFVEWLLDVPLTEEQRRTIVTFLVDAWRKNQRSEIDGMEEVLKLRRELSKLTAAEKEVARQAAQPEAVKQWRTESDAAAKMLVGIYDAAHRPIAPGDPPLTRQSSDAMLEVLLFMAAEAEGQPPVAPTKAMKDEWAKGLAAGYDKLDADGRTQIAQMPGAWAALRFAWPELSDADKKQLRAQWERSDEVRAFASALPKLRGAPVAESGAAAPVAPNSPEGDNAAAGAMQMSYELHRHQMNAFKNISSGWTYQYRFH